MGVENQGIDIPKRGTINHSASASPIIFDDRSYQLALEINEVGVVEYLYKAEYSELATRELYRCVYYGYPLVKIRYRISQYIPMLQEV